MSQEIHDFVLEYLAGHRPATAREIADAHAYERGGPQGPVAAAQMLLDLQAMETFREVEVAGRDGAGSARWRSA